MEWIRSDSSSVFGHHREHHSVTKTLASTNATAHSQTLNIASSAKLPRTRFHLISMEWTSQRRRGKWRQTLALIASAGGGARARAPSVSACGGLGNWRVGDGPDGGGGSSRFRFIETGVLGGSENPSRDALIDGWDLPERGVWSGGFGLRSWAPYQNRPEWKVACYCVSGQMGPYQSRVPIWCNTFRLPFFLFLFLFVSQPQNPLLKFQKTEDKEHCCDWELRKFPFLIDQWLTCVPF